MADLPFPKHDLPRCQQCHRTEKDHAYTAPEVCWWTPPSPTTIEIPKSVFDRDRQRYMRFANAAQIVNVLREDGSVSASFGGTLGTPEDA